MSWSIQWVQRYNGTLAAIVASASKRELKVNLSLNSSIASFLVYVLTEEKKSRIIMKHMRERAKRASASETCIFRSAYIIQLIQFPFDTYGMALYKSTVYRQNPIHSENLCIYASEWSERAQKDFVFSHSKTAISFNTFWYFRYFVGTKDWLVGLHVPTIFRMYQ